MALITLRSEEPGDDAFLFNVYASTRQEELALTPWDESTRHAFLKMQFDAMKRGYRSNYPAAEFSIIMREEKPIGRLVLDRAGEQFRVVDIALLSESRNRGVGTIVMQRICQEAAQAKKPVRLCVLQGNRALQWYARLGFVTLAIEGIYIELEWRAPGPLTC
jgi:ribosomal protein S18 acetylase RimI-like enzyme